MIWTNWSSAGGEDHTQDRQWVLHTVEIPADAIAEDGTVALGWEIISDGGLEFGGWNLDDVCVYGLEDAGSTDGTDGTDGSSLTPPSDGYNGSLDVSACSGCASGGSGTGAGLLGLFAVAGLVTRRRQDG